MKAGKAMENNNNINMREDKKPGKLVYNMYDIVSVVVTAMVVIFVVFTFVTRILVVSGDSMLPTLQNANSVAVSSSEHSYEYGDIVIITQPNILEKTLIKRVIAVGGQTVDIDTQTGTVYVDGKALDEDYTLEPTYEKGDMEYPLYVPEGYIFAMGDNRNRSSDSRMKIIGLIDERYIMGKVYFRVAPFGQWEVD